MPKFSADLIVTQKHKRNFIQFGGARPGNGAKFAGQDAQLLAIEGVTVPDSGGVDPVFVPNPNRVGQYKLVGRKITPPDLASATLKILENHGSIPRQLLKQGCVFNLYEVTGKCRDLSDFLRGWESYVLIYSSALVESRDLGTRTAWDSDDQIEDSLSLTLADVYPVGALGFGEQAAAQVDREVIDVVYANNAQCGDCGPADDGTNRIYSVTASSGAGSPGIPPEVQYSLDGGSTWYESQITGIGASATPSAIDIVGDKLVVLVSSENAYYWSTLNSKTGVPGTWTKVTTGFVASKLPNDIYVSSPTEVFIVGDGGYVYKSTDITAGVTVINAGSTTTSNLKRVHGADEIIVAVGSNSVVIRSINRGNTFATTTTNPSSIATDVTGVFVLDANRIWVTLLVGRVAYTLDGGTTWTHTLFDSAGTGVARDIVFATEEVGYFSHDVGGTARMFATWDGGASWTREEPRITNLPTFTRANRLAVPKSGNAGVDANALTIAGLSGGGTDGILLAGEASLL